jgi:hypothetical protein
MSYKKIPSKIRIKSKETYEVVWTDLIGENEKTLAECRYDHKQIVIKNGQSETENWKCFIHECLHAMEFEYRIPVPHKIVYLLEEAIFKLLKLNGFLNE